MRDCLKTDSDVLSPQVNLYRGPAAPSPTLFSPDQGTANWVYSEDLRRCPGEYWIRSLAKLLDAKRRHHIWWAPSSTSSWGDTLMTSFLVLYKRPVIGQYPIRDPPSCSQYCILTIMREIVHLQIGQCGNQIGSKVTE